MRKTEKNAVFEVKTILPAFVGICDFLIALKKAPDRISEVTSVNDTEGQRAWWQNEGITVLHGCW